LCTVLRTSLDTFINTTDIVTTTTVQYYVIAGTRPYEFNLGLFTLTTEQLLGVIDENDGIITAVSAQHIGEDRFIDNTCDNYFEVNLTHTDLIDHPIPRRVMARIITEDIAIKEHEKAVIGYNQYLRVKIPQCSEKEVYVVVGKRIDPLAAKSVLDCGCGNNVCGIDESIETCPQDCAQISMLSSYEKWAFVVSRLVVLVITLGVAGVLWLVFGRKKSKHKKFALNIRIFNRNIFNSQRLKARIRNVERTLSHFTHKRHHTPRRSLIAKRRTTLRKPHKRKPSVISKEITREIHKISKWIEQKSIAFSLYKHHDLHYRSYRRKRDVYKARHLIADAQQTLARFGQKTIQKQKQVVRKVKKSKKSFNFSDLGIVQLLTGKSGTSKARQLIKDSQEYMNGLKHRSIKISKQRRPSTKVKLVHKKRKHKPLQLPQFKKLKQYWFRKNTIKQAKYLMQDSRDLMQELRVKPKFKRVSITTRYHQSHSPQKSASLRGVGTYTPVNKAKLQKQSTKPLFNLNIFKKSLFSKKQTKEISLKELRQSIQNIDSRLKKIKKMKRR